MTAKATWTAAMQTSKEIAKVHETLSWLRSRGRWPWMRMGGLLEAIAAMEPRANSAMLAPTSSMGLLLWMSHAFL